MDTAFFILAKVVALLIRPDAWLALGLGLAALGLWRGWLRLARRAATLTLAATLAIGVLPLGDLALRPLETRHPPAPDLARIDGIIVLGGAEEAERSALHGSVQMNEGAERLTEGLRLARLHPGARLVFTGGSGYLRDAGGGGLSGAEVAGRFWAEQGHAGAILEGQSRNTAENARLTAALIRPAPGETWVLVTSAFHMPRAVQSFRAAGWPGIVPWPVDYRSRPLARGLAWELDSNLMRLRTAVNEYVGLIAYRLAGR